MKATIRTHKKDILFVFLFIIILCGMDTAYGESNEKRSAPGKLLVMPFNNMADRYGSDKGVRCPICGKVFITGQLPDKSVDYLNETLLSMLRQKKYYKKIVTSDSEWAHVDLTLKKFRNLSEVEMLREAGRSVGADAVMVGYVYRFQRRVGSKISVDTPASVAFGLHLIDVKTGRSLWNGHVDETQRSLSENLFTIGSFIKRKATWVTAEEMAESGLKEILQTLE